MHEPLFRFTIVQRRRDLRDSAYVVRVLSAIGVPALTRDQLPTTVDR